jgi:ribose transport system permease protein
MRNWKKTMGMALLISGGQEHIGMSPIVEMAGDGVFYGIAVPVILVLVVTLLLGLFTLRTQWGRWIYAVGGNPDAAHGWAYPAIGW